MVDDDNVDDNDDDDDKINDDGDNLQEFYFCSWSWFHYNYSW